MEAVTEYLFKQGLGYVLFIGSAGVCTVLFRLLIQEKDRRAQDVKDITQVFTATAKDLLNALDTQQRSLDAQQRLLENILSYINKR